ncbi:rCG38067 [Rattus norvegicus]|uniref:RCG38067 n=1 Tax=Rattus norvegicus TaxID=10116 RepID=A6IV76_RAT|nr:rCG38067 [Rattus norvegicus]
MPGRMIMKIKGFGYGILSSFSRTVSACMLPCFLP